MDRLAGRRARRADPRLDRDRPAVPRDLPRPAAAVRGQRRGRRGDARCPAGPDPAARRRSDAPHIGWNQVERRRAHPAFDGIAPDADFYFVHSYAGFPDGADDLIVAETAHGRPFVSAVARGQLLGVQFHPERSGDDGLRLLGNFAALASAYAARRPVPA